MADVLSEKRRPRNMLRRVNDLFGKNDALADSPSELFQAHRTEVTMSSNLKKLLSNSGAQKILPRSDTVPSLKPSESSTASMPTPFRVLTMTFIASLNTKLDCELVFNNVRVVDIEDGETTSYPRTTCAKYTGQPVRGTVQGRRKHVTRSFKNQVTLDVCVADKRRISVKLFLDGRVQMTGCITDVEAHTALQHMVKELERIRNITIAATATLKVIDVEATVLSKYIPLLVGDANPESACGCSTADDELRKLVAHFSSRKKRLANRVSSYAWKKLDVPYYRKAVELPSSGVDPQISYAIHKIAMINSVFDAKLHIDRAKLRKVLVATFDVKCAPTLKYPAVNAKFASSADCKHCKKNAPQSSKEKCADLHRRSLIDNGCVNVSILAFQQGKVILTGAQSLAQIEEAYAFVTGVFRSHYHKFSLISQDNAA